MSEYTKVFENPYPNGWKDLPSEETPITADALQEHTDAIENIEDYLNKNPITQPKDPAWSEVTNKPFTSIGDNLTVDEDGNLNAESGGSNVEWNQLQKSGTKIAEITIEGQKTDVYSPTGGGGGGGASTWNEVADKPFETIGDGLSVDEDGVLSAEGGDANFWEGTLAMFEAEADSIPDGTLLNIKDDKEMVGDIDALVDAINGEPVAPVLEVYDDEERIIGTWFGKPLYRKVFPTTLPDCSGDGTSATRRIELEGLNIEDCPRTEVYVNANGYSTTTPYFSGDNPQRFVRCYVARVNGVASHANILNANTGYNGQTAYLILEYTKVGD